MSYSYAYLGSTDLDDDTLAKWLAVRLDVIDPAPVTLLGWGLEASGTFDTVEDVLDDVARWRDASIEVGPKTRLRVLAAKDGDAWLTYRGDVALVFLALSHVGGRGQLDVVGFDDGGPDAGYRIAATPELDVRVLDEEAVDAVRRRDDYRLR